MPMPNNKGIIDPELKTALDALREGIAAAAPAARLADLQKQVDAIDIKMADKVENYSQEPALIDQLRSNDDVSRLLRDEKGSCILNFDAKTTSQILQTKTVLTESGQGFQTTGVLPIERIPGITPEARQQLTVRDVLTARPTSMGVVDFVKVPAQDPDSWSTRGRVAIEERPNRDGRLDDLA